MKEVNSCHQNPQEIASDQVYVLAAQSDMKQFAPLYDKYYVLLFRFVYQRTDTKTEAADITSQVFLNAMKYLKQYTPQGLPFSSWLFRIAHNEINQWFRKHKAERNYYINTQARQDLFDESVAFQNEQAEQKKIILSRLLENLTPDELAIIEMKYAEKRSIAEISEILDLSESNTKVRLHRIMNKLRSHAATRKLTEVLAFLSFCTSILFYI
ncbi:MAG: sigma-70 family RNA polymerase sigma factor [Bacteroidota bacterium]